MSTFKNSSNNLFLFYYEAPLPPPHLSCPVLVLPLPLLVTWVPQLRRKQRNKEIKDNDDGDDDGDDGDDDMMMMMVMMVR